MTALLPCNNVHVNEERVRARLVIVNDRLRALGVKSLSLFGSASRGSSGEDSDLDFLVEFEGPATFDRYMGLRELLEAEFQSPIDLVTKRALRPMIRDQILGEAVRVA